MSTRYDVTYQVSLWKEDNFFVAAARPLDVLSAGTSASAAKERLREAVQLLLETAIIDGTIEDIIAECGYIRHADAWVYSKDFDVRRFNHRRGLIASYHSEALRNSGAPAVKP